MGKFGYVEAETVLIGLMLSTTALAAWLMWERAVSRGMVQSLVGMNGSDCLIRAVL